MEVAGTHADNVYFFKIRCQQCDFHNMWRWLSHRCRGAAPTTMCRICTTRSEPLGAPPHPTDATADNGAGREAWKPIVDAVHRNGALFFGHMWHVGWVFTNVQYF